MSTSQQINENNFFNLYIWNKAESHYDAYMIPAIENNVIVMWKLIRNIETGEPELYRLFQNVAEENELPYLDDKKVDLSQFLNKNDTLERANDWAQYNLEHKNKNQIVYIRYLNETFFANNSVAFSLYKAGPNYYKYHFKVFGFNYTQKMSKEEYEIMKKKKANTSLGRLDIDRFFDITFKTIEDYRPTNDDDEDHTVEFYEDKIQFYKDFTINVVNQYLYYLKGSRFGTWNLDDRNILLKDGRINDIRDALNNIIKPYVDGLNNITKGTRTVEIMFLNNGCYFIYKDEM